MAVNILCLPFSMSPKNVLIRGPSWASSELIPKPPPCPPGEMRIGVFPFCASVCAFPLVAAHCIMQARGTERPLLAKVQLFHRNKCGTATWSLRHKSGTEAGCLIPNCVPATLAYKVRRSLTLQTNTFSVNDSTIHSFGKHSLGTRCRTPGHTLGYKLSPTQLQPSQGLISVKSFIKKQTEQLGVPMQGRATLPSLCHTTPEEWPSLQYLGKMGFVFCLPGGVVLDSCFWG